MNTQGDSFALSSAGRLQVAAVFGLAIAALAYASVRVLDVVLFPEPNPAIVIWTDRSRFIWRVLIASYLGGAGVFGGFGLALQTPEIIITCTERLIFLAGACVLFQVLFAP